MLQDCQLRRIGAFILHTNRNQTAIFSRFNFDRKVSTSPMISLCWIFRLILITSSFVHNSTVIAKDLYGILNVKRSASAQEIKKAYRNKARETHPDKQKSGGDPEKAAAEFREVVEAFETLSDTQARQNYDRTGKTVTEQNARGSGGGGGQGEGPGGGFGNWNWNFHFNQFNQFNQQNRQQNNGVKYHHYLYDPYRKRQILDAQSRAVNIKPNLDHLKSVIFNDDDDYNIERYVLIAFYDSSRAACVNMMNFEVLYPWPFAGFTQEGSDGIWWEEYMMSLKVDMKVESNENFDTKYELAKKFGIKLKDGKMPRSSCPSFAIIPRGGNLEDDFQSQHFEVSETFRDWAWQQLKMRVTIVNKTPWNLHGWWIDGDRGKRQEDLAVDASIDMNTFISHSFYYRADFVTGNLLTNESALIWYRAKIRDDGSRVEIKPRCFDHSGDCVRWKNEGFCSRTQHTFYTRQNPNFVNYVLDNCFVSCKVGCGAVQRGSDEL